MWRQLDKFRDSTQKGKLLSSLSEKGKHKILGEKKERKLNNQIEKESYSIKRILKNSITRQNGMNPSKAKMLNTVIASPLLSPWGSSHLGTTVDDG